MIWNNSITKDACARKKRKMRLLKSQRSQGTPRLRKKRLRKEKEPKDGVKEEGLRLLVQRELRVRELIRMRSKSRPESRSSKEREHPELKVSVGHKVSIRVNLKMVVVHSVMESSNADPIARGVKARTPALSQKVQEMANAISEDNVVVNADVVEEETQALAAEVAKVATKLRTMHMHQSRRMRRSTERSEYPARTK